MDNKICLKEIFERQGVFISDDDCSEPLIFDSLQYVSLIVAIEDAYGIEIDDSYLAGGELKSYNDFLNLINTILLKGA